MMDRRTVLSSALALSASGLGLPLFSARAQGASLPSSDASAAVVAALERGAEVAVNQLGKANGFMDNDKIRIPLPAVLEKAAPLMRTMGRGKQLDELVSSMNHAAENAVALAMPLLKNAIKSMSVQDARGILTGGDMAVTNFFSAKTRAALTEQFLPVVDNTMKPYALTKRYNDLSKRAAGLGLLKGEQTGSLQEHVTSRALDGLYFVIGEEERRIRADPVATGSALLKKVFSAL